MPDIAIQPGVILSRTDAEAQNRWVDTQWMRFTPNPEKIKGFETLYASVLTGVPRAAFCWKGPDGFELRAYGTEKKLYVGALSNQPVNVTPLRLENVALANNPFSLTDGSTLVTVIHVAHGAVKGDTVILEGASLEGGNTIPDGSYDIVSIISVDRYTINVPAPLSVDSEYGNVALLLHGNGADASTTITDNSTNGHTVTAVGNAQIDQAQQKFGTASILFDGTGDLITVPDHATFEFGSGAFTFEMFVRFNALPTAGNTATFLRKGRAADSDLSYVFSLVNTAGVYTLVLDTSTSGLAITTTISKTWTTPLVNTWYHVAVCRTGSTVRIFVDGIQVSTNGTNAETFFNGTGVLSLGASVTSAAAPLNGWLDEVRLTAAARYITNFSVPVTSFTQTRDGRSSVVASYEINVGLVSSASALGYGVGPYGAGAYGVARSSSTVVREGRAWSLDSYGTLLIAAYTYGSRIYLFEQGTDSQAQLLANSPTDVRFIVVTSERFIFALCADMTIKWPDVNDPTDWTPADGNTADQRTLHDGNKLVAGATFEGGITLIWSDLSAYMAQYIGGNFIYDIRSAGMNCGLIGPHAFCLTRNAAFWMGSAAFHTWNGSVQAIPNSGDVDVWVYENLTKSAQEKSFSFYNEVYDEVWFLFAAVGGSEPTHFVLVNLDRFDWSWGTLERVGSAMSTRDGLLMTGRDGNVYVHELGLNADGAAIGIRLRSGLWRVASGDRKVDITGFAMDAVRHVGAVDVTFRGLDRTDSDASSRTDDKDEQTMSILPGDGMVDPRIEARYFAVAFEQELVDGDLKLGVPTIEVGDAGARR